MQRFALLLCCLAVVTLSTAKEAMASSCKPVTLTTGELARWFNPHPSPDDFELPLPGGLELILTPVELPGRSIYGAGRTIFSVGSSEGKPFENKRLARIGSTIFTDSGHPVLYIGKYEFTKGQFVMIKGQGQLDRGLEVLRDQSKDPNVRDALAPYFQKGTDCFKQITPNIASLLAEPLTFLTFQAYQDILLDLNKFCMSRRDCREKLVALSRTSVLPAYVRLPTEQEWEYCARGGRDYASGKLSPQAFNSDLPSLPPGKSLADFAHLSSEPPRLSAIGSRAEMFGLYDMIGNADELVSTPFTSESMTGATGGYVSRGGHFRMKPDEVRFSLRTEQPPFHLSDETGTYEEESLPYTGIRPVLGLPLAATTNHIGSNDVRDTFVREYQPLESAGETGSTFADARDLGKLKPLANVKASLTPVDRVHMYTFEVVSYADLTIAMSNRKSAQIEVYGEDQKPLTATASRDDGDGRSYIFERILPSRLYVKVFRDDNSPVGADYSLKMDAHVRPRSGVPQPDRRYLSQASRLLAANELHFGGYVGPSDRTNTFPVSIDSNLGGATITVSGLAGPVTVSIVDDSLHALLTVRSLASDSSLKVPFPCQKDSSIFVQITAEVGTSTTFEMSLAAQRLFPDAFSADKSLIEAGSLRAKEGVIYEGFLTKDADTLYTAVEVDENSGLRIELTNLTGRVDLAVSKDGAPVDWQYHSSDSSPKFFSQPLPAGRYQLSILMRGSDSSSFRLVYRTFKVEATDARTDPKAARNDAEEIALPRTTLIRTLSRDVGYFFINTGKRESFIKIDLFGFTAADDLDLYLEDADANVIAKSEKVGSEPESISKKLEPASPFFIRVVKKGTSRIAYFNITADAKESMAPADRAWLGDVVGTIGPWSIYSKDNEDCAMVTRASKVSPDLGWRDEIPDFYVVVHRTHARDSVVMAIDTAGTPGGSDLYAPGSVSVFASNGRSRAKLKGEFDKQWLKLISPCTVKGNYRNCVDTPSLRTIRASNVLEIHGKAPTTGGNEVVVTYDVAQFANAAARINTLCKSAAWWLVKN